MRPVVPCVSATRSLSTTVAVVESPSISPFQARELPRRARRPDRAACGATSRASSRSGNESASICIAREVRDVVRVARAQQLRDAIGAIRRRELRAQRQRIARRDTSCCWPSRRRRRATARPSASARTESPDTCARDRSADAASAPAPDRWGSARRADTRRARSCRPGRSSASGPGTSRGPRSPPRSIAARSRSMNVCAGETGSSYAFQCTSTNRPSSVGVPNSRAVR